MIKLGIIGGSGLEKLNIFNEYKETEVLTTYGKPSSGLLAGKINDLDIVIISRHGKKHNIPPTQVNNRANIMALKDAGCTHIIATTACGSLRDEIKPGDMVVPDQFIDFTRHRSVTFYEEFENGNIQHTQMAEPFNGALKNLIIKNARKKSFSIHEKGTVITIEGPRFSTKAESNLFRLWGADLINMSTAPEVILANEASIPYATIALSTDYDCWKTDTEPVTWEKVFEVFNQNVHNVTELLIEITQDINNNNLIV